MNDWYTISEAAELLKAQPQAIRAYVRRNKSINSLCEKRSGRWVVTVEAIEELKHRPGPGKPKKIK